MKQSQLLVKQICLPRIIIKRYEEVLLKPHTHTCTYVPYGYFCVFVGIILCCPPLKQII